MVSLCAIIALLRRLWTPFHAHWMRIAYSIPISLQETHLAPLGAAAPAREERSAPCIFYDRSGLQWEAPQA